MKKLSLVLAVIMLMSTFGIVGAIPASAAKTSVLNGKSAIFVGDSIMAGWRDSINGQDYANGRGWGYRIRDNYSMTVNIAARAGEAMSSVRDAYMDPIYKQLENNKNTHYDYVILEGGFNDIMGNEKSAAKETAPLGTMSTSFNLADFDRKTFASGLEHLLCTATTLFPNAKIGFIITFETPYSNRGNGTNNRENTKKYFDLAKQICDKWNVPYLDFYSGSTADGTKYFDVFYPEGTSLVSQYPSGLPNNKYGTLQNIKDDIHPNKTGYDVSYEYVAKWMETLPTYSKPSATSALSGKSALFVGDSIMAGGRDSITGANAGDGLGWGYRIRENYGMTVDIAAVSGQAMSTVRDTYMEPIYKQLEKKKGTHYDYVILQGGFNDIYGNEESAAKETTPLGTMSTSYNLADFDRTTFASALEHLLCYAATYFPDAKVGFVITHETPYSRRGNGTNDRNTTKRYFDLAKQICDKWNVPYLDFYDGATADGTKYFDLFYPEGRSLVSQYPNGINAYDVLQRLKDDIHPNKEGYDVTYTHMARWMETLPTYAKPSPTSVLRGKTALFAGDSITYGYMDSAAAPRSWALRLQNNYGMIVSNRGENGHSLSDVRDYTAYGNVDKRLHVKCFVPGKYDYVILHGGVNDAMGAEPGKGHPNPSVPVAVGTVAKTKNPADFDTATFAGGLERYFYEATTRYPSARIGFIINYQTPNSNWGGATKDPSAYWDMAREICDKWDIPYLDLYQDSYSYDVLKANTTTYLCDTLHLNAAGYDVISPYIAQWMATLEPYGDEQEPATDVDAFVDGTEYHYDYNKEYDGQNGTKYYSALENGTDYNNCISLSNGVDTRLVTGGYNNAAYAMKMSYTKNASATANNQHYAMFSVPNIHSEKKNGRNPGQAVYLEQGATFKITVTYKVTGYASDAALYVGVGSIALSNMMTEFTSIAAEKVADITAATDGWQKAQIVYTAPSGSNVKTGFYLLLKMADDTRRAGTEVIVGAIDITSAKTTVVSFDSNGGSAVDSVSGKAGTVIPYPADPTREGYTFDGWHTVTDKASAAVFPLVDVTYVARWKLDKNGWVKEDGKWYFYENGETVKNTWRKDSVGWVFLGKDGAMLTNAWCTDSKGWCYVGADGYAVTNCWKKDSHGWIWLNANGSMTKSAWVKDGGKWYYLDGNGYMVSNQWRKDSKGWVYLGASGAMLTNAWCTDSKGWCYVGADGYAVTNCWKKDSKGWIWLDKNGSMTKNAWVKDGGKWYYLDGNGYMVANKSLKIGGKTYRFNASGAWVA